MRRNELATGRVALLLLVLGCADAKPAKKVEPASLERAGGSKIATVTLTERAVERLGIVTEPVTERAIHRRRTFGCEATTPQGGDLTVTAPMAGALLAPKGRAPIAAGEHVERGQVVFRLLTDLPSDRVQKRVLATEAVAAAGARLDLADAKARRAAQLLAAGATSVRMREEADAERAQAEAAVRAADERLAILERSPTADGATTSSVEIRSPIAGVILRLDAAQGQTVAASATLFRVMSIDPLWIKVPVFAGDLGAVDRTAAAGVGGLLARRGDRRQAPPVVAPPTADPRAATVDLVYELANDGALRPGQRLSCEVSMQARQAPTLPTSAVLYDVTGASWVYENTAPLTYVRRPVTVDEVVDDRVVLGAGPAIGTAIVTVAAAELFGTELGVK